MRMMGLIFSIEEFAVHDGDGLRTAVFFKGCPLRCSWCHNPEGLLMMPQRVRNPNGCLRCGRCDAVCPTPTHCTACGHCAAYCPRGLIRVAGQYWDAEKLAAHVKANFPPGTNGGVTLTGGEVLMQPDFLLELLDALKPLSRAVETCGYGDSDIFSRMLERLEFVFMDVKLMDGPRHLRYTGRDNRLILENLEQLKLSDVPFVIRVPVIAGVNDDDENLLALAACLSGCSSLRNVELLPYNPMAGAKYGMLGWEYKQTFVAPDEERLSRMVDTLIANGVRAKYRKPI